MKINRKQLQEIITEQLLDSDPTVVNYPSISYDERVDVDTQDLSGDGLPERKFTDDQLIDMILESLRCPTSGLAVLSNNPGLEAIKDDSFGQKSIIIDRRVYDPSADGGRGDFSSVTEMTLKIV